MAEKKHTLLIIEDDLDVAEMLNAYFRVQGYEVLTADYGEDGVQTAITAQPDLIILDIRLPDIDGFEVARRLRTNHRTKHIPIIFLTEKRQRVDRIQGLELGADDYVTKPFDIQELKLRVRNALRRAAQGPLSNPITNLPEGALVDERLEALLRNPEGHAALVLRIDHLMAFREARGFVASDDALRAISVLVQNTLAELDPTGAFTGHIGPSELLVVLRSEQAPAFDRKIRSRIDQSIDLFYPLSQRERAEPIQDRLSLRVGSIRSEEVRGCEDVDALKQILVKRIE